MDLVLDTSPPNFWRQLLVLAFDALFKLSIKDDSLVMGYKSWAGGKSEHLLCRSFVMGQRQVAGNTRPPM